MAKKQATAAEKRYLDKVAQLPCMLGYVLGENHGPANIHHIRTGQGGGQRASHYLTIPLCKECHQGPLGVHGGRTLMRIAKVEELDLLSMTIEMMNR